MENILYELWEWWIRKGERQWLDRIINLESGGLRAIRSSAMRLSQPFHSAFQTFDAMRAHYTFKHWHGSNFSCQNLPTLNSWFPSTSVHLLFNAPISTMIEDDRKRIRSRGRTMAPNSDGIQFRTGFAAQLEAPTRESRSHANHVS